MAPLNWLELPNHLHALFMNKLSSITDYIHFGSVCRSWRFVFDHYIEFENIPPSQLPLLLIPSSSSTSPPPPPLQNNNIGDDDKELELDKIEEKRSVYSISHRKVYDLGIKLSYNIHCRGSSYGWLITVEEDVVYSVRLFNPFLPVNNEIQLPPLKTFQLDDDAVGNATFLARTILSKDPILSSSNTRKVDNNEDDDLVVVAIYGQHYRLAFCKLGDESSWTCLQYELLSGLADVTYYKGMLYMVKWRGEVVAFDLHAFITSRTDDQYYYPKPKVVSRSTVVPSPLNIYGGEAKYIVESSGDLLQVQRFHDRDDDDARTIMFRVFKLLNEGEEKYKWEEVKSLRGQSLFVGDNASMSLTASEFSGCMPNCIYFTDDSLESYPYSTDLGVFNLIDGSIEQHYKIKTGTSICPPPIWVQPTLES